MNERAKEVASMIWGKFEFSDLRASIESVLASLPEFNYPTPHPVEWIRCADRMPEVDAPVYINDTTDDRHVFAATWSGEMWEVIGGATLKEDVSHWCVRYVPSPPVEEEDSALVKALRKRECPLSTDTCDWTLKKAIATVKEFERKGAAK